MDLSIIIPVYQVEEYIGDCLEPLTKLQDLNFEVLLIDDGSRDNSIKMASSFQNRLPLKIISQANGGASAARNRGLKEAKGRFIFFYDSDDFILPQNFQQLVQKAMALDLDICSGMAMISYADGRLTAVKPMKATVQNRVMSGAQMYSLMVNKKEFSSMIWLRVFQRSLLEENNLRFSEGIIHEDEEFTALCFAYAQKVAALPIDFYRYRFREGSVSKSAQHKYANPKSLPALMSISQQLHSRLGHVSAEAKHVIRLTIARMLTEVLRRLDFQRKAGEIKKIPSWQQLKLDVCFSALPWKYRWPVWRYRLKLSFK